MNFRYKKEASVTIVELSGRMSANFSPDFEKQMNRLIASGEIHIVVDFGNFDFIGSSGSRAILAVSKQPRNLSGKMLLAYINGSVTDIFAMSGFGSIFPV